MVVAESGGSLHLAMRKWSDGLCESKLKLNLPSLSSRNTLGDTSHNSNKLKQNWVKLGWWKCMVGGQGYAEVVVVRDEETTVPK